MLDHVTLGVSDIGRSKIFYDAALWMLGITRFAAEGASFAGYGAGGKAFFWIGQRASAISGAHVAFAAEDRAMVDQFYASGLAHGGRENGAPGLRPQYHPDYYGAFILDPDGHNIEAVCRTAGS